MANQHTVKAEREALRQLEVSRWERERRHRVEALCAAITHQRQALSKAGNAHLHAGDPGQHATEAMAFALSDLHEALKYVVNETNPFER